MNTRQAILLLVLAVGVSTGAAAAENGVPAIIAQQEQIRLDVQARRAGWDAVDTATRAQLLERQGTLLEKLAGKASIDELHPTDQIEVANTLEWIKAVVTQADDERRVCSRERKTGSNRSITVCRSAGDVRRERERTRDAWAQGRSLQLVPGAAPPGAQ